MVYNAIFTTSGVFVSTFVHALAFAALFATSAGVRADEVVVSAAASLTNAFREIAAGYQHRYPGAKVGLNFGASGALLQQVAKGAPVDVFASADQESMDQAEKLGLVAAGDRHNFTTNSLVVVTPIKSSLAMSRLADLARPAVTRIAIGAPASVPAGRYAKRALETASLWSAVEPRLIITQNVRQALSASAHAAEAKRFVAYLLSPAGQAVLIKFGFSKI
jgi:molybdate transport system substrate-binding protein